MEESASPTLKEPEKAKRLGATAKELFLSCITCQMCMDVFQSMITITVHGKRHVKVQPVFFQRMIELFQHQVQSYFRYCKQRSSSMISVVQCITSHDRWSSSMSAGSWGGCRSAPRSNRVASSRRNWRERYHSLSQLDTTPNWRERHAFQILPLRIVYFPN